MNSKNLLLVGCGNLGKRHLEALLKLNSKHKISVVEANPDTIVKTKNELTELENYIHEINWYENLDNISETNDLVIISTNATGRKEIILNLLKHGNQRFLIEKMVCQSKDDYDSLIQEFQVYDAKGWVDTSRRYFPFYQQVANEFKIQPVHLSVKAGNIGLGTNAIHFLDLFSWFSKTHSLSLNGNSIDDDIFPNKRDKNLVEFSGKISGISDNDSTIEIEFFSKEEHNIIVEIRNKEKNLILDETLQQILSFNNFESNGNSFRRILQSNLTNVISEEILSSDKCKLPTLEESYSNHVELFRIFNNHLHKNGFPLSEICPIT